MGFVRKNLVSSIVVQKATVQLAVLIGCIAVHAGLAYATFRHFGDVYGNNDEGNATRDFWFQGIILVVLDATFAVYNVNRASVRQYHWKIALPYTLLVIARFYAPSYQAPLIYPLLAVTMVWVYWRLAQKDHIAPVMRVGLEKYTKKTGQSGNYLDISIRKNAKYVVVAAIEAALVYNKCVSALPLAGLTFVVIESLWLRIEGDARTKFGDFWFPTVSAGMDTGIWMSLFQSTCVMDIQTTILSTVTYLALVEVVTRLNGGVVRDVYNVINTPLRWFTMAAYTCFSVLLSTEKNNISVLLANMCACMLFSYISSDIVLHFLPKKYVVMSAPDADKQPEITAMKIPLVASLSKTKII